ncbi:MAG: hypothetical protein M3388_09785 [Acidobacteriota bacterium]|nr:hypothetical protein [Acidobacteriota bacterium]
MAGDLNIVASKTSSPDDFDFFIGNWKVHNQKLNARLKNCEQWTEFEALSERRKILNGFENTDSFCADFDGMPFEGMTLRLFNPQTKLWSIYWADSNAVVLDVAQIGSFENKVGKFYARDVFEGKEIIVQFIWDATNSNVPVWSQAFSADNGETWGWNWYMNFHRQG